MLVWDFVGFPAATLLLLLFLFRCVEPLRWRTVLIAAVLTLTITYILFSTLLGARLPARAHMDLFHELILGFGVAIQPVNLFYCFLGCLIGTLVGVLPGLGPTAAMSLLLPATFHIAPVTAIIMLAGIYYGAMYGGSTTSILVNIPGEAASVMTCLDGYQMARQGQGRRGSGHVRLRLVHRRDPRPRRPDPVMAPPLGQSLPSSSAPRSTSP